MVEQINRVDPDFVVHLGDLVHPVPILPSYDSAAGEFERIYGRLDAPLHTIPGNHDIGDKPGPWMPAAVVDEDSIAVYRRQFGNTFYSFDRGGCRCIMINNPVLNSGLPEEKKQREWLQNELAENAGRRIFLFMHYPLYLTAPDEPGHYENLDDPARSWFLSLVDEHSVEAVFAGHTHNFFFNRYQGSDLYVLPSVTSVRQDYSELFRVEPGVEYGRNDTGKFGFFVVSVYENGYDTRFVRTAGKTLPDDGQEVARRAASPQIAANPEVVPAPAALGADLRHPRAEITEIPYNYILDEFQRKKVRNDYPVLALWDLGIQKLRLPIQDFLDPRIRGRMQALGGRGHRFKLFAFDTPSEAVQETLIRHRKLIDGLEIILPWNKAAAAAGDLSSWKKQLSFPLYFSPLETSGDDPDALNEGIYYVRHGFRADQRGEIESFLNGMGEEAAADGLGFRVGPETDPWEELQTIGAIIEEYGVHGSAIVQMASDDTAEVLDDDRELAGRTARAAAAASLEGNLDVFIDTFVDMDRGYFVRIGLVDRRYNPRLSGRVLGHLRRWYVTSPYAAGRMGTGSLSW